ncbi:MAG: hypothetical protein IKY91_03890 [Akkermansia sp.]|nr:hypothetical protein [Akkermansia sp.]
MLSSSFSSDLPAAVKELARLYKIATRKALSEMVNRLLTISLPNTISNTPRSGPPSRRPTKKAINALKKRIVHDILGDNKVGSGLATGIVNGRGGVVWGSIKGQSSMPFLIRPTERGRKPKKKRVPPKNLITSGSALVKFLDKNTYMPAKKKTAHRVRLPESDFAWVTLRAARAAAKAIKERAGYYMSGWDELAYIAGNKNFDRIVKRAYPPGSGSAVLKEDDGIVWLDAVNDCYSLTARIERYCQRIIDNNLPDAFGRAFDRETEYAEKAFNKWLKNNIK